MKDSSPARRIVIIIALAPIAFATLWFAINRIALMREGADFRGRFDQYESRMDVAQRTALQVDPELQPFFDLYLRDRTLVAAALDTLEKRWRDEYAAMALDVLRVRRDRDLHTQTLEFLVRMTGQDLPVDDVEAWYDWIWRNDPGLHPMYAGFKAKLYAIIDPSFEKYFGPDRPATIRLDEVRWGGVRRDGIPPLDAPAMLAAADADYLDDDNVVFGIEVNGDARAYPKRILAWHEMFKDTVGGEPVTGVYCTLCGSMILYRSVHDGVHHELGTSGFLYRSNKLMYDHETYSLWNTIRGVPVIGPLVGRGIELEPLSVVTTTWGQWRMQHPDTTVLSLETGHRRDYGEGVAYQRYFATDDLMFGVPELDDRLDNKAEVLALRFAGDPARPLAIEAAYLAANPIVHETLGDVAFVVLTDAAGANRVYETGGRRFASLDEDAANVTDGGGGRWRVEEDALVSADGATRLARLPSHRAFWFGWHAVYPETRLITMRE